MVKNWLPVAAICLAGSALLSAVSSAQAAKYLSGSISSIKVAKAGLFQTVLTVSATITNPGAVDIDFDAMNADLFLNNQAFAKVAINAKGQNIRLKQFADTVLTFPVTLSNGSTLSQLLQIVKNGGKSLNLSAQGNVYSGALLIPFSTTYAVTTPTAVAGFLRRRNRRPVQQAAEIGKMDVKLQFDTIQDVEDYFSPFKDRPIRISKN